jgi:hypothetical protein
MGWTYSWDWTSKQRVINHCIDWGERYTTLSHSVRGKCLWVLLQYNEGEKKGDVFVALYLLAKDEHEWGYKDMDDTVGPCYYDCPLSFIKRTVASGRTLGQSTLDWHEQVKAYHLKQRAKTKQTATFSVGMTIKYAGQLFKLIQKYPGRWGWQAKSLDDGAIYRLMAKQVSKSELVSDG